MLPLISVIIAVRSGEGLEQVLGSLTIIDYPHDRIEILIAEGTQPSKQRNEAARRAQGDILYFLDNDSVICPKLFRNAIKWFCDDRIAAVGGPSITKRTDSFLQKCFGYALGAFFGTLWVSNRYEAHGWVKEATEWDLILANLAMRRDIFFSAGGFNEQLYPNEENELLNRLKSQGYHFIYDAEACVFRSQRENLAQFARQLFDYGRGRMEHFFVNPGFTAPIFLVPLAFAVYLCSLPLALRWWWWVPLGLYVCLDLAQTIQIAVKQRQGSVFFLVPFLFPLMHISYGCGLAWALVRRLLRRPLVSSAGSVTQVIQVDSLPYQKQVPFGASQ